MVTPMCSQLTYEGLLDEVDKSFSSWHRSLDNENMICLCEILRACLAWLQLCLEQLHSKIQLELALGGVGAGWLVCLAWRVPPAPEKRVVKVDFPFCPWFD